jgi:hypothetical protein
MSAAAPAPGHSEGSREHRQRPSAQIGRKRLVGVVKPTTPLADMTDEERRLLAKRIFDVAAVGQAVRSGDDARPG